MVRVVLESEPLEQVLGDFRRAGVRLDVDFHVLREGFGLPYEEVVEKRHKVLQAALGTAAVESRTPLDKANVIRVVAVGQDRGHRSAARKHALRTVSGWTSRRQGRQHTWRLTSAVADEFDAGLLLQCLEACRDAAVDVGPGLFQKVVEASRQRALSEARRAHNDTGTITLRHRPSRMLNSIDGLAG